MCKLRPIEFFHSSLGLRQGCPISFYLFIICADALSSALQLEALRQVIDPYRPVPGVSPISHMFFVDDSLLMGWATIQNAMTFKWILETYYAASGQKVNLLKSAIYFSPKTRGQIRQSIRDILGIAEHSGAMHYLGISISGHYLWRTDFAEFVASI